MHEDLAKAIRQVIADKAGRPASEIRNEDRLGVDLGFDSMDTTELELLLESRLAILLGRKLPREISISTVDDEPCELTVNELIDHVGDLVDSTEAEVSVDA